MSHIKLVEEFREIKFEAVGFDEKSEIRKF